MTLEQWSERTGIPIGTAPAGTTCVFLDHKERARHGQLWKLEDYAVSSVASLTVFLIPRTRKDSV